MKNNYIALGLIFGAGLGINIGVATNNLAIGLAIGSGVGLVFGTAMKNRKRKCENKNTNIQ